MENEIKEKILKIQDKKYGEFHRKLCPGIDNIIGVRVPMLRNLAKELQKEYSAVELLQNIGNEYYEEIILQGMVIGQAKLSIEEFQRYIEEFVPKINNWAICDTTVAGLKLTKKHLEEMWKFIQKYLKSSKEYEIRFAVVMMLDYYIKEEYIDQVLEKLNNISHEGYYVKMAVAWTLSLAFIKFPEKTMKLFKSENKLDDFTYNKALQKSVESYRIDEETKKELKSMKRKM